MPQQDEGSLRSQASGEVVGLRGRVFDALRGTFEDEGGRFAPGTAERLADAVMAVVAPELERLDKLAGGWWQRSQQNGAAYADMKAERDALRAQLARAVFVWPQDAMVRIRERIADPSRMGPREDETVAGWGARAVIKLMESWRAPVSESVPATPEPCGQVHDGQVCKERRVHDTNGCWGHYGPEVDPEAQFACAVDLHIAGQVPCPHCVPIAGRPQPAPSPKATSEASQDQANSKREQNLEYSTPPSAGEADTTPTPRLRGCVERWPDCEEGAYNPSCCRFPKSCSCTIYNPANVSAKDLESPSPSQRGGTDG